VRFLGFAVRSYPRGLDGQQGLQGNRVAAIAKNIKIESSWLHHEYCSAGRRQRRCFCRGVFLVRHVGQAVPLLILWRYLPAFPWPSFSNLMWIPPGDHRKCNHPACPGGIYDRSSRSGRCDQANEQKKGLSPQKLVMTSKFDGHLDMVLCRCDGSSEYKVLREWSGSTACCPSEAPIGRERKQISSGGEVSKTRATA
jgi:hypothetical protein